MVNKVSGRFNSTVLSDHKSDDKKELKLEKDKKQEEEKLSIEKK